MKINFGVDSDGAIIVADILLIMIPGDCELLQMRNWRQAGKNLFSEQFMFFVIMFQCYTFLFKII